MTAADGDDGRGVGWTPPVDPGCGTGAEQGRSFSEKAADAIVEEDGLFSGDDFEDIAGPMHWPSVLGEDSGDAWAELRRWVEQLIARFSHIDHHVIPLCWWRHNGHVEALVALRDHERMCFQDSAPPSAGVEWHRAFRDIEARLREWTSALACGASHDPRTRPARATDEEGWGAFIAADTEQRPRSQPPNTHEGPIH